MKNKNDFGLFLSANQLSATVEEAQFHCAIKNNDIPYYQSECRMLLTQYAVKALVRNGQLKNKDDLDRWQEAYETIPKLIENDLSFINDTSIFTWLNIFMEFEVKCLEGANLDPVSIVKTNGAVAYLGNPRSVVFDALRVEFEAHSIEFISTPTWESWVTAKNSKNGVFLAIVDSNGGEPSFMDKLDVPFFYIASSDEFNKRFEVSKMGCELYVQEPVLAKSMVATVCHWRNSHLRTQDYKVLYVGHPGMHNRRSYLKYSLSAKGIQYNEVLDVNQLFHKMDAFKPDIVVVDDFGLIQDQPETIAEIIQQSDGYSGMPVMGLVSGLNKRSRADAMMQSPLNDVVQFPTGFIELSELVNKRITHSRYVSSKTSVDSMTGLWNHEAIKGLLRKAMAQAARKPKIQSTQPLFTGVVMIDIDHFKSVNDTYGHPVGDAVIKSLASHLTQSVRQTDWVGRYGGEEFVLILPDITEAMADTILNRIRDSFSQIVHVSDQGPFRKQISLGLYLAQHADSVDECFKRADEALYLSKHRGRNKLTVWRKVGASSPALMPG